MSILRLQKLLAKAEADVISLRRALDLLGGDATEAVIENHPTVLDQAIALDEERRSLGPAKRGHSKVNTKRTPVAQAADAGFVSKRKIQRQKAAAFLAQFDPVKPRQVQDRRLLRSYLHYGYLAEKGDGIIRTRKPWSVD
jgi:hypothetical protein